MSDDLPPVEMPQHRPMLQPSVALDEAMARLRRTAARLVLADLQAKGVTFSVREGRLFAGPAANVVNGTAQRIDVWKEWFLAVLQELPAK